MKKAETKLWNRLKTCMKGEWDYHRHEDAGAGVPDISFCYKGICGWIELKHLVQWPKRKDTHVKTGLTPIQKVWMKRRWRYGGNVFVLIEAPDKLYYIFSGRDIFRLNELTQGEMMLYCDVWCSNLKDTLTTGLNVFSKGLRKIPRPFA